nr:MAG: terminase large subunit [Caudoviricetes sp.]
MAIREELIGYSRDCLEDRIPSGGKHKQACQRFLQDLGRIGEDGFPYVWDEGKAGRIVKWFSYLRHSKGELAGQPIILTAWQKFFLCQLYGWRHKDTGYTRFKKSVVEVGRKNAKSQMEAGVALNEISEQATRNGEVYEYYTAGVKRQQSKIIFNECKLMLRGSPLKLKFRITRDAIEHKKTGSFIVPLRKVDGRSGDGTNPAGLILDEYHQHPTTDFYDLGLGAATKEPLLMIITTAGTDLTYPCYTEEYAYCSKILDPDVDVENDGYFVDICEADEADDPDDIRTLQKANPIRAYFDAGLTKLREEWQIAKEIPEKLVSFKTKCLNIWMQARDNGYMDMAKWKACEVKALPIDVHGRPVYVGFDMSSKIDLTSVAFVIPFQTDRVDGHGKRIVWYIVYSHSFIPTREKLREHILKDKVPYDAWERMGYLEVTDTPIVDQGTVMEYVLRTCEGHGWRIQCLCFDPANASKLMMDLSDEGYDVEEVFQSHKSLNESTQGFREQVHCQNVHYLPNPLLNYAMSNAVIRQNNGLIKIDKDATTKRIDPVDAVLCAFKLALYHDFGSEDYADYLIRYLEGMKEDGDSKAD